MTPEQRAQIEQQVPALPVQATLVWTAVADVAPREALGASSRGERWIVPITGGHFWGAAGYEKLHGIVRSGGADRQLLRPDGIKELDALYEMQTHDGAVITIHNPVLIDETVQPSRYAMSCIRVSAPLGAHEWLNRRLFLGTLQTLRPQREAVLIRGWLMDTIR